MYFPIFITVRFYHSFVCRIYLIKPLILRWLLQNSFHDALQFINSGGLFGICEDGRLMTSNHKKHILGGDQQQEGVSSALLQI